MKKGTKLRRINQSSASCKVFVDKIYTYAGAYNGFIKLKERKTDGYAWQLKNFVVVEGL